ncbi:MAG: hypothetical protein L0228_01240, partial [Planctomycetes bacterium]|nr:hypothetical protein [Planctomycetota bacterium]
PAPYDIVFTGGVDARFEEITNWSITRPSPGEADTTTHWQPSRFDVAVINSGTITVDSVGQHAGTIRLASGPGDDATLSITSGWLKVEDAAFGPGNGEVIIGANAAATAVLNLSGGELTVKTLSKGTGGQFNFTGGTLHADVVNFDLENNGGTIAPGQSPGGTTINGDLQINSGALEIELASPSSYDTVTVAGSAALGGDLLVRLLDGFVPDAIDQFTILTGQTISGAFDNLTPSGRVQIVGAMGSFQVTIDSTQVMLSNFSLPVLAGDYNDDGVVDAADYVVWRRSLETSTPLDNETASIGINDQADYDAWRANFGASLGSGSGAAVPEPTSTMLAVVATLTFCVASPNRLNHRLRFSLAPPN